MLLIDIEMPERCGECPCFHAEHPMYCQLIKPPDKDKRIVAPYGLPRPEWCPLKEQEVRELTIDEWREWKTNPKRNPICELWENDTSPMWILNPNDVHEPAFLMGKLKLFTGKPTLEQCKEVKWE